MTPYYQAGGVTLWLGDCLTVLPTLKERFDLVVTSPPYNLGGATNGSLKASRPRRQSRWGYATAPLTNGYGIHADAMTWPDYVAWQRRVLLACWERLEPTGAIFYNHKPVIRDRLLRLPLECNPGLPLRQIVVWDRGSGFNFDRSHYCPVTEWLLILAGAGFNLRDQGASKVGDLWRIDFEQHTPHPAPFPLALPATAIETTGARSVLDPFVGWGTTALAAKLAGVRCVGIDVEERFLEMAARRLEQGVLPFFEVAG